jgi:hypothetical protein
MSEEKKLMALLRTSLQLKRSMVFLSATGSIY